jgi:hypothetical protein
MAIISPTTNTNHFSHHQNPSKPCASTPNPTLQLLSLVALLTVSGTIAPSAVLVCFTLLSMVGTAVLFAPSE